MKIHYGTMINEGNYEQPLYTCNETLCGLKTEIPCENATNRINSVNCKKCLKIFKKNQIESEVQK